MKFGIKMLGWALTCPLWLGACADSGTMDGMHVASATESAAGSQASAGSGGAGSGGQAAGAAAPSAMKADLAAFEATGLNKYLGKAKPADTETSGDETHYAFNEADGPVCLRGGRFAMATRDRGAEDLVIYLQGGGSCTTALCRATETANPQIPQYGVLNADDAGNPVAGWNVVYSPYCDGSLHFGDNDIPDQDRKHHGLRNVSASLDVAHAKFPKPRRVLLTGASAGGYATIWMTSLVRLIYPDAKLFVFNDAGIAISNPASADGFRGVLGEWGAAQFVPETCEACRTSPHLTPWMSWNLQHDPGMTLAMFSSYEDMVIAGTFLMLDPQVFKQALLQETAKVVDTAPKRAKRFLVEGTQHTAGDIHKTAVGDLAIAQWLGQMLDGNQAWDNALQ
jgi:hypothetical protein